MNGGLSQYARVLNDAYAKQRTAEIIAEVEGKYQPRWDAAMARFDDAHWTDAEKADATRKDGM